MKPGLIIELLSSLSRDSRITVWHMGMYSAFLQLWHQAGCRNPISITRRRVLELSHIGNIVTYHKCLKELEHFGYLRYLPSYHPQKGSLVFLHVADTL